MTQRTMLLTGASRGIGHATVKLFRSLGWRLLTVSRQPFSEECAWPEARDAHIQADLADLTQIDRLVATVRERCPAASWMPWSTMPASRPRGRMAVASG